MALLATQQVVVTGLAPTFAAAAAGGDTFRPQTGGWVVIKNGGGSAITATFVVPGDLETGTAYPDVAISVPATTGERWVPADDVFVDKATGLCSITYSGVTTVTVGAFVV